MKELNDNELARVNGGEGEPATNVSAFDFYKNNTTEHYFMKKDYYGTDYLGITCWFNNFDTCPGENSQAKINKNDIRDYYHSVDYSSLPDWAKLIFQKYM